jgi:photosynthetic reaction center cytochrome c subunit
MAKIYVSSPFIAFGHKSKERIINMKWRSKALALAVSGMAVAWAGQAGSQAAQAAAPEATPMTSEHVFKNIQVLKGIPVDDFMGTMGLMSAALGFDCSECHANAGTDKVDWAADTPNKLISRRMVEMVTTINRTNFGGRQLVTCWTCHRNRDRPVVTPSMDIVYGTPLIEPDDIVKAGAGKQTVAEVLDRYIQALGGAQRLAGLTSFVGKGRSVGFGGLGGGAQVTLFAKAPDQRTLILDYVDVPDRGDTTRSYNGKVGWLRTPLNVVGEYELSGGELDGARLDAQLSFPGQIKQVLTNLKVGTATWISDLSGPSSQTSLQESSNVMVGQDRSVDVVQGTGPRGLLTTLYFAKDNGLLLRMVRYGATPIGRVPTQIDFADYRDVEGIKFPFRMTFAWLDGRDAIQLNEIQTNVPIDEAKFGRPAPLKKSSFQ